jgi:hypothetical protein
MSALLKNRLIGIGRGGINSARFNESARGDPCLAAFLAARIERIAQTIANEVDAQHTDHN